MEKYIVFDGKRFLRDEKTGYYCRRAGNRTQRLHKYVYEFYNGEVPDGFDVHHVDGCKDNNDISNLVILTKGDHAKLHGDKLSAEQRQRRRDNLTEKARPKAAEWHRTKDGRKWHKAHYAKMKAALYKKEMQTCKNCGKQFEATREGFCSNRCKSAYRRRMGFDNIVRLCEICGRGFLINKYEKTKTCSRACAVKLRKKILSALSN